MHVHSAADLLVKALLRPPVFAPPRPVPAKPPAPAPPAPAAPAPRERVERVVLDGRQCRIWLNEARREIDRLRRSLARPACRQQACAAPPHGRGRDNGPGEICQASREMASPSRARRLYAVDPVGGPWQPRERGPATAAQPVRVMSFHHVTNLGTMLDALA